MSNISTKLKRRLTVDSKLVYKTLNEQLCHLNKDNPIFIHTDIINLGLLDGEFDGYLLSEKWLNCFLDVSNNRPLIIPTFNYDFTKTGKYEVHKSLGQVGLLSKHCSIHHSDKRTLTPVFNCCVFNGNIDQSPSKNAFGESSIFHYLFQNNGILIFLGTDMRSNTFIHYLEEIVNVGYRYLKLYKGVIINGSEKIEIDFLYRVRPILENAVIYDHKKVLRELHQKGLLQIYKVGLSKGLLVKVKDFFEYVKLRMEEDELYLLTNESKKIIYKLYKNYGRPLTFEAMEGS